MILKTLKDKPHHFYLLVSILFLTLGFLMPFQENNNLDINIHDTYYVVEFKHLYWLFSMVLFVNWIICVLIALSRVVINKTVKNIQILMSIISCLGIIFPYDLFKTKNEFPSFDDYSYTNELLLLFSVIYIISNILLFIIIFLSIFKVIKRILLR
ncbi:membrane hypothetical protein [Flavobacterium sp. 9AF]|uniref:hypothetical protein n=1 Tax=Flavobacterium sp. 9AF TaxID=2653142 RepID=UPI0012EF4863|nr:hypothetical protein [Flavobacterium sp. 9AF]VXA94200.1 membrane hypothetical protein [Flavobacterium sp. 9AF]